jgi:hypothetical protein
MLLEPSDHAPDPDLVAENCRAVIALGRIYDPSP